MAQHDFVIDNGTGSAVRTDINNVLQAIASNNSNSGALTTNYAYQWHVDTSDGNLKIRNAANNGYVTVGPVATTNFGLAPLAGATFTGDVIHNYTTALQIPVGTTAQRPGSPSTETLDSTVRPLLLKYITDLSLLLWEAVLELREEVMMKYFLNRTLT